MTSSGPVYVLQRKAPFRVSVGVVAQDGIALAAYTATMDDRVRRSARPPRQARVLMRRE